MKQFQFPEDSSVGPQIVHHKSLKSPQRRVYNPAVICTEARVLSIVSALYAAEQGFIGRDTEPTAEVSGESSFGKVTPLQHVVLAGNVPLINTLRKQLPHPLPSLHIPPVPTSTLSTSPLAHWVSRFTLTPLPVLPLTVNLPLPHESVRALPPIPIRDGSAYYDQCTAAISTAMEHAAQREQQLHRQASNPAKESVMGSVHVCVDPSRCPRLTRVRSATETSTVKTTTNGETHTNINTTTTGNSVSAVPPLAEVPLVATPLQLPLFVRDGISVGDAPVDALPLSQVLYAMSRGQGELDRRRVLVREGLLLDNTHEDSEIPDDVEIPERFASFLPWSDEPDPSWVDWAAVRRGQEAYRIHCGHVFIALSFVLVLGFVERRLADVLVLSGEGLDMSRTYARYLFTNRHVMEWVQSDLSDPHSPARRSLRQVRCLHAHARCRARDYYAQEAAREALARVRAERAVLEAVAVMSHDAEHASGPTSTPKCASAPTHTSSTIPLHASASAPTQGGLGASVDTLLGVPVAEWEAARFKALHAELRAAVGEPLSQYDLALVQLAFSTFCLSLMSKCLGLTLTTQEQHDVCHLWRYLGFRLGIKDEFNACDSHARMLQCADESYAYLVLASNDKTARLRVRDVRDMLQGVHKRLVGSAAASHVLPVLEELDAVLRRGEDRDAADELEATERTDDEKERADVGQEKSMRVSSGNAVSQRSSSVSTCVSTLNAHAGLPDQTEPITPTASLRAQSRPSLSTHTPQQPDAVLPRSRTVPRRAASPLVFSRVLPAVPGTATAIAKITLATFSQHTGMGRRVFPSLIANCTLGQGVVDAAFTGIRNLTALTHRSGALRAPLRSATLDIRDPFPLAMLLGDVAGDALPVVRDTYLRLEADVAVTAAAAEYAALTPIVRFRTPAETKHPSLPLLLKLRAVPPTLWRVWAVAAHAGVLDTQPHEVGGKWRVSLASIALDCANDSHFRPRAWLPRLDRAGRRVPAPVPAPPSAREATCAPPSLAVNTRAVDGRAARRSDEALLFRAAVLLTQALFAPAPQINADSAPTLSSPTALSSVSPATTPVSAAAAAVTASARCPFSGKVAAAGASCPFARFKISKTPGDTSTHPPNGAPATAGITEGQALPVTSPGMVTLTAEATVAPQAAGVAAGTTSAALDVSVRAMTVAPAVDVESVNTDVSRDATGVTSTPLIAPLAVFAHSSHTHTSYTHTNTPTLPEASTPIPYVTDSASTSLFTSVSTTTGCPVAALSAPASTNSTPAASGPASTAPDPDAAATATLLTTVLLAHTTSLPDMSGSAAGNGAASLISTLPGMLHARITRARTAALRAAGSAASSDLLATTTLLLPAPPASKAEQAIWDSGLRDHTHMRALMVADTAMEACHSREAHARTEIRPEACDYQSSVSSPTASALSVLSHLIASLALPVPPRPHPAASPAPSLHSVLPEHQAVVAVPPPRRCPLFSSARALRIATTCAVHALRHGTMPHVCIWPENLPLPGADADFTSLLRSHIQYSTSTHLAKTKSTNNLYRVLALPAHEAPLRAAEHIGFVIGRNILYIADARVKHRINDHLGNRVQTPTHTHRHLARMQRLRARALNLFDAAHGTLDCVLACVNPIVRAATHMRALWRSWMLRMNRWRHAYTHPDTILAYNTRIDGHHAAALCSSSPSTAASRSSSMCMPGSMATRGSRHEEAGMGGQVVKHDFDDEAMYGDEITAAANAQAVVEGAVALDMRLLEDAALCVAATATGWEARHHRYPTTYAATTHPHSASTAPSSAVSGLLASSRGWPISPCGVHSDVCGSSTSLSGHLSASSLLVLRYAARHSYTPVDAALMLASDSAQLRPPLYATPCSHNGDVVVAALHTWLRLGCGYNLTNTCTPTLAPVAAPAFSTAVTGTKSTDEQSSLMSLVLSPHPSPFSVVIARALVEEAIHKCAIPGSPAAVASFATTCSASAEHVDMCVAEAISAAPVPSLMAMPTSASTPASMALSSGRALSALVSAVRVLLAEVAARLSASAEADKYRIVRLLQWPSSACLAGHMSTPTQTFIQGSVPPCILRLLKSLLDLHQRACTTLPAVPLGTSMTCEPNCTTTMPTSTSSVALERIFRPVSRWSWSRLWPGKLSWQSALRVDAHAPYDIDAYMGVLALTNPCTLNCNCDDGASLTCVGPSGMGSGSDFSSCQQPCALSEMISVGTHAHCLQAADGDVLLAPHVVAPSTAHSDHVVNMVAARMIGGQRSPAVLARIRDGSDRASDSGCAHATPHHWPLVGEQWSRELQLAIAEATTVFHDHAANSLNSTHEDTSVLNHMHTCALPLSSACRAVKELDARGVDVNEWLAFSYLPSITQ